MKSIIAFISFAGVSLNVLYAQAASLPVANLARRVDPISHEYDSAVNWKRAHVYGVDADEVANEKRAHVYGVDADEVTNEKRAHVYGVDADEVSNEKREHVYGVDADEVL